MKFNTGMTAIIALALVEAASATMRRYVNDTMVVAPTLTGTGWSGSSNVETLPTFQPTNSTSAIASMISASITWSEVYEITTTVIRDTTLSYTLGPSGSRSVITTVVKKTSTITMTTTKYITKTKTQHGESSSRSINDNPAVTAEPTVTVTDYQMTTKTITVQNMQTAASDNAAPHDDSNSDVGSGLDINDTDTGIGSGPGAFFPSNKSGSNAVFSTTTSRNLFGGQHSACGVTTVTETVIEKSTVTVTPTSTDNFPIDPTASPTYGYGNGTNPSGFPTASSGFLTLYRRSQPTKM